MCVFMHFSSTFIVINVALNTGPHRRRRGVALYQEVHKNHVSSFDLNNRLKVYLI